MQAYVYEGYFDNGKFYDSLRQVVEIPEHCKVYITLFDERVKKPLIPDSPRKKPLSALIGSWKGMIWMSDDFDAPLEEMREYM
jgi:hypothetical protein